MSSITPQSSCPYKFSGWPLYVKIGAGLLAATSLIGSVYSLYTKIPSRHFSSTSQIPEIPPEVVVPLLTAAKQMSDKYDSDAKVEF